MSGIMGRRRFLLDPTAATPPPVLLNLSVTNTSKYTDSCDPTYFYKAIADVALTVTNGQEYQGVRACKSVDCPGASAGDYGSHLQYRNTLLPCSCDQAQLSAWQACLTAGEWFCDSTAAEASWAACQGCSLSPTVLGALETKANFSTGAVHTHAPPHDSQPPIVCA